MSAHGCAISITLPRSLLLSALWLTSASTAVAQSAPASSGSAPSMDMPGMDMSAMDHAGMPDMDPHVDMRKPPASASTPAPAKPAAAKSADDKAKDTTPLPAKNDMPDMHGMPGMGNMPGMDHAARPAAAPAPGKSAGHDTMQGMGHGSMVPANGGDRGAMRMGPMQGGTAPTDARSGDYSDGIGYGPMRGMDMRDNAPRSMLLIDQLEAFHARHADGQVWQAEGWYGNDDDKLWLRSEGERSRGRLDDGDIEALWNHVAATYWSSQLGLRQDMGQGPSRRWAAFGVQGLAPYWFELEATGYVGDSGRTAARFRAEYELRFTQRLVLQPEFEVNLYGQSDRARRIGSGLSDAQLGLRLRYEISRRFAPYVGVVWTRRYGRTADFVRDDPLACFDQRRFDQSRFDRQWVAGVRFWF